MLRAFKNDLSYVPPIAGYQSCVSGAPGVERCDQPVRSTELWVPPPPRAALFHLVVFCMIRSACVIRVCPCEFTGMPAHDTPIDWLTNEVFIITIIGTGAPLTTVEASPVIKVSTHLVQRTRTLGLIIFGRLFLPSPPSRTRNPPLMRVPSQYGRPKTTSAQ